MLGKKLSLLKLKIVLIIMVGPMSLFAQKTTLNNIPALNLSLEELAQIIIPPDSWKPYTAINHPGTVPQNVKQAYIHEAEKIASESWTPLPASVFLEYAKISDRDNYEQLFFERRKRIATLVLAEVFENKGRFTKQIVNGIWAICEESFWGVPAHLFLQKAGPGLPDVNDPVVDLFAAETAAELAWIYYLFKPQLDEVNPIIAERLQYEVNRRVFVPYLNYADWTYLGFKWRKNPDSLRRVNNWNPWVNSNVLAAALILSKDGQRNQVIHKTLESISNFIAPFPADGGNDEGPQYWGRAAGSLFDYLDLLKSASNGKIDAFTHPFIKKMGSYIYKVYIKDQYFVNYGDADGMLAIDPALLYRFGKQVKDDTLLHFAAYTAKQSGYGQGMLPGDFGILNRVLPGLFSLTELLETKPREPLIRDVWLPDTEIMTARSKAGSSEGLYLAVKGGNNGVSHNHNDAGNFVVYANGRPVLIDAGTQDYTSATFSNKRYDIWNNQSSYHNLPAINGKMQQEGAAFKASDIYYSANNQQATIAMNIASAYPAEAKIVSWKRNLTLSRGKQVCLKEKFVLGEYVHPYEENFMSPLIPSLEKAGVVLLRDVLSGEKYRIYYDQKKFSPYIEKVPISVQAIHPAKRETPVRMSIAWGDALYRIRLVSKINRFRDEVTFIIK